MGKQSLKEVVIRCVILLVGLVIAHLGVTLFLLSNLGSDPFNVFVQGLYKTISKVIKGSFITHGRVHMVISFIIIIILLKVDSTYIKIGTVLCMVCGGPIIDMFNFILNPILGGFDNIIIRMIISMCGCIILAYGMTIVIKSEAGTGPNDLVALAISEKKNTPFSITRIVVDGFFTVIGFLLSATVGLGTVICMVLVGPIAGKFLPINEKMVKKIINTMNL